MTKIKSFKSASYGFKAPSQQRYPSDGYYYALCDVCGRKLRIKDLKRTFGTRGNLLVCSNDYENPHPQDYLRGVKERAQPKLARSEAPNSFQYIDSATEIETGSTSNPTGRVPGAPTDLKASAESSTKIVLQWRTDKSSTGSSTISGFKIERESPTGNGFSTLVATTGDGGLYYEDKSLTANTQYNYRVSSINDAGTSSASNEAADTTDA